MGVKHVEAFGDSLLVVQQVSKVCQCYNGSLNAYLDKCLDIISIFDEFIIKHIPREENEKVNTLAQQASGYNVMKKYFNIRKPMQTKAEFLVLDTGPTGRRYRSDRPDRSDRSREKYSAFGFQVCFN